MLQVYGKQMNKCKRKKFAFQIRLYQWSLLNEFSTIAGVFEMKKYKKRMSFSIVYLTFKKLS